MTYRLTPIVCALALTACGGPGPEYDISPRARAALPEGQDLAFVFRAANGCYTYIAEDRLSGNQIDLFDDKGRVCDPIAL